MSTQQISPHNDLTAVELSKEKKLSLLVLVLLEIVFGSNSILYEKTIEYLITINLIDPDTQSDNFLSTRTTLFNMIIKLNESIEDHPQKLLKDKSDENILINSQHSLMNIYGKNFRELCVLGSGSFASVYQAQHRIDYKLYAIKKIIITDDLINLGYDVFDEVKMLASLSHPNVLRYYSSWIDFDLKYLLTSKLNEQSDDDSINSTNSTNSTKSVDSVDSNFINTSDYKNLPILCIQTELCDYTLKEYIETKMTNDSIDKRFSFWLQMLQGVKYIHLQGIVHRDIKPSNVLFLNENIKIGDFGLSKNISSFALQISKSIEINCGHYRAPEVLTGNYDQSIDLYALGIILLEMMINSLTVCERIHTIRSILNDKLNIQTANLITHQYDQLITTLINPIPTQRYKFEQIIQNHNAHNL